MDTVMYGGYQQLDVFLFKAETIRIPDELSISPSGHLEEIARTVTLRMKEKFP
jgi:hypothetical protein